MLKKAIRFLIPVILLAVLNVLYLFFEDRFLQVLSTWPESTLPQNILRITLGLASLLVLVLSYWVLELKRRVNDKKADLTSNLSSPPPLKSKAKDFPFEKLIWSATNNPPIGLYVYDVPRCKLHDLVLTYDGYTYHCPESLLGKCDLKLSKSDLSRLKRIAISYIDKQFREEPPPPAPPTRPRKNWVTDWRKY